MRYISTRARAAVIPAAISALLILGACDRVQHDLLDAPDPDIIDPASVNTPEAADALRIGALGRLRIITAGGEGAWMLGGLLTDEWKSGDTFSQRNETDQRVVQESNGNVQTMYRELHRARTSAREALNALVKYKPDPSANLGQMYFVIAFAEMTLAEDFCNGQPLSDASKGMVEYGPPLSNVEIYNLALQKLDSAINLSTATDDFSVSVNRAARVAKARVLIDLGRFNDVAAVIPATAVPTDFQLTATFSLTAGSNQIWSLNTSAKRWVVGDSFDTGGRIANAIPFASAGDPRVPVTGTSTGTSAAGKSFDTATNFIFQKLWGRTDATPIVSGLDARLMEAEVRLQANDYAGMTGILNTLRGSARSLGVVTTPVMAALAVPATRDAAIDQFFREKAFWTFGRGQRLGDLRRLVRQYNRAANVVFPTGQFFKGGSYGADTNFPATVDEQNNPNFTGCANRDA
jgi:starch-binding outer membrane protein, SusD/RagB family